MKAQQIRVRKCLRETIWQLSINTFAILFNHQINILHNVDYITKFKCIWLYRHFGKCIM